jgi:oligosaccharide translocation protein RFT1
MISTCFFPLLRVSISDLIRPWAGLNANSTITSYFDTELLNLSIAMTGQSVIKHFLTEGDKFLVSRLSPLEDQGGYAIASNYGALNIIFLPTLSSSSRHGVFFS